MTKSIAKHIQLQRNINISGDMKHLRVKTVKYN